MPYMAKTRGQRRELLSIDLFEQALRRHDLSSRDLALRVSGLPVSLAVRCSHQHISRLRNGERTGVTAELAKAIAHVLKVPVARLFGPLYEGSCRQPDALPLAS